jgi:hypothetical protein
MMTETRGTGSILVAAFILMAAMVLYMLLDLAAAASLNPVISGGFALAALALGLYILDSLPLRQRLVLVGLLVTAVFAVRFIDWDSRKPFLRDFNQIQMGMTTEEVDGLMSDYIKSTSPLVATSIQGDVQTGAVSYRHTAEGWGDSDIGLITFAGGRVIGRTFYPD